MRTNINNLAFGRLFDLANSSALAILLDTSSSMQAEIDAVKLQIKQIIEVKISNQELEKKRFSTWTYFLWIRRPEKVEWLHQSISWQPSSPQSNLPKHKTPM